MKRILINATQQEELRVALVDGQHLYDLDIESAVYEKKKGNIYKGTIARIEASLEAAFVNYGAERHGFLPFKEISRAYFTQSMIEKMEQGERPTIENALKEGQEIIIQVEKEERGNKGAALTTFISMAGRYLVYMPNNPRAGGISRRIEGKERQELREAMRELSIPSGAGAIVRTAGVGKNSEELQWDLDYQHRIWESIEKAAAEKPAPFLIYQESDIIIRALRDYLRDDIGEILVDDDDTYRLAQQFMSQVMPQNLPKLKKFTGNAPIFTRFQVESQLESAFQREVKLPSGGSIVIDHTEALISIDINSARATKGSNIEETALNANLEAADEIARQLRLRDSGGLVVIDFIDMNASRNQRAVENRLRDALRLDRARVQVGKISRFGLLEMSRQRLRPSLGESSHTPCPRCNGQGTIRGTQSLSLSVLRLIQEEALKEGTAEITAQLPIAVATYLLNEKREEVAAIEKRMNIAIVLVPNHTLETPHYAIERSRKRTDQQDQEHRSSYDRVEERELPPEEDHSKAFEKVTWEKPAVREMMPNTPMPPRSSAPAQSKPQPKTEDTSFVRKLISGFSGLFSSSEPEKKEEKKPAGRHPSSRNRSSGNRNNRGGNRNRRGGNRNNSRSNSGNRNNRGQGGGQNRSSQNHQNRGRKPAADSTKPDNAQTQSAQKSVEKPVEKPTNKPAAKPVEKSATKPAPALEKKPAHKSENKSENRPATPPADQSANKPATPKPAASSTANKPAEKPTAAPTPAPAAEKKPEPAAPKPASKPTSTATPKPAETASFASAEKPQKSESGDVPKTD